MQLFAVWRDDDLASAEDTRVDGKGARSESGNRDEHSESKYKRASGIEKTRRGGRQQRYSDSHCARADDSGGDRCQEARQEQGASGKREASAKQGGDSGISAREIEDTLRNDRCAQHGAQQQQCGSRTAARECEEKASQWFNSPD